MEVLFWIFFGLGMAFFVATITTFCIRATRYKGIPIWCNLGLAVCSLACSIINIIVNG